MFRGMNFSTDNEAAAEAGEVLILAVKPHLYSGVLEKLEVLQNAQEVLSICKY